MKNRIFLLIIVCLSVILAPATVFAKDQVPFSFITSETDDFQPSQEYSITFSPEVTINAKTVKGAKVTITVEYDESLGIENKVYGPVTIGATCKLMQPIALNLGTNQVQITVSKDGYNSFDKTFSIKRKNGEIQNNLQNLIVIPQAK